jgi:Ca-activated chloride channel family protein
MTWAEPLWLLLLAPVLLLAIGMFWATRRHHARLTALFSGLAERVLPSAVRRRRTLRDLAAVCGLILATIALAGPRSGMKLQKVEADGVDLVIVLDLSLSMDARDVDPNRLERARREIADLVDLLEGDRVGIVIFAGGAWPRLPLTLDRTALRMVVTELDTSVFEAQGSALGLAIDEAMRMFESNPDQAGQAILVLSDGEIHDPAAALVAGEKAAQAGVAVYGMVVGSTSAPIPVRGGSFLVDPATRTQVMTQPSPAVLTDLARTTGGAVVQSVASDEDIRQLYQEIRTHVRTGNLRETEQESWNSLHDWPLGIGVLLLLLAGWLGDGRRAVALALMLLMVGPTAQAGDVYEGDRLYREGRYAEAVQVLADLARENPDDPDLLQRLGAARYRAGDYLGAARAYERAADLGAGPDASFDAGNAWWQSGAFDKAMKDYDRTLAADPQHPGATTNRGLLAQEMQERRQQQQQQQQQQQGEPQQGDPQQGEPQQGQPQQGEPQGDPQQGQQGEQPPQDDAAAQGEAEQGKPEDQQDPAKPQDAASKPGEAKPGDENRKEEGDGSAVSPSEVDGADQPAEGAPGSATAGQKPAAAESAADQASRTLDGVEEGHPRTYVPGRPGEKPW